MRGYGTPFRLIRLINTPDSPSRHMRNAHWPLVEMRSLINKARWINPTANGNLRAGLRSATEVNRLHFNGRATFNRQRLCGLNTPIRLVVAQGRTLQRHIGGQRLTGVYAACN